MKATLFADIGIELSWSHYTKKRVAHSRMAFDTKHPHSFIDRERSFPEDGVSSADLDAPGATHQDAVDMLRLGKKQEFKRNFNFWSTLGFISIYMATWEFVLVSLALGLWNGGFGGRRLCGQGSFLEADKPRRLVLDVHRDRSLLLNYRGEPGGDGVYGENHVSVLEHVLTVTGANFWRTIPLGF